MQFSMLFIDKTKGNIFSMKYTLRVVSLICLISMLQSCGFKLRGSYLVPTQFQQLYVAGPQKHAPIERTIKSRLSDYDVTLLTSPQEAIEQQATRIRLGNEELDRRLLSLFSTGQVAEYELLYQLKYVVLRPNLSPTEFTIELTRQFQDDPDAVLAKSRELELILGELRKLAADQIIRQLATL
jgi:LPS-assembly lipoprotein